MPKLVLECPREVTSVSVSPLDGNLVIGGCANGQLSIKNLKNLKIKIFITNNNYKVSLKKIIISAIVILWRKKVVKI